MVQFDVRLLGREDLEQARWVVYRAYAEVLLQLYGPDTAMEYELRSLDFMSLYLEREPEGCFAAVLPDGTLVGVVFGFVWGQIGWFGSLGVLPEWQGHGVGQALTARIVRFLEERGCTRIGLETWPEAPLVRHLYGKFGFVPVRATVKFARPVRTGGRALPAEVQTLEWTRQAHGAARLQAALADTDQVTAALHSTLLTTDPEEPVVDYGSEIESTVRAGWAELATAYTEENRPAGFALCFLKKPSAAPVSALDARLIVVAPGEAEVEVLDALLAACDARAAALSIPSVSCDLNLRHSHAGMLLVERGFRPTYELMRMERPLAGFDPNARSALIECARWAG